MSNVVDRLIADVFDRCREMRDGELADYIPELADVDVEGYGIAIATSDGYVYEVGDTDVPFSIQSISKPFTYGLALADCGIAAVGEKIDVEPSGEPFNEISLDPHTEHPRNPMINAGAITATSLVHGDSEQERFERIRACYSSYAGRELQLDQRVYESEVRTGHRNLAIGHMLRSFDILADDPDDVVDTYFRQCSLQVTCRDLSLMAATMANNGVQPITGERALSSVLVERVLSVMTTCGMYDAAGSWVTDVGLPAKSGVSGGVLAVLPGQLGIAVYSPRLDGHGNSVRGVATCQALSENLELHFLHVPRPARSSIRDSFSTADVPSRTRRTEKERETLQDNPTTSRVVELHGDLMFAGAENAVREITRLSEEADALIIDVRRVDEVSDAACRMIDRLREDLLDRSCSTVLVDPKQVLGGPEPGTDEAQDNVFADLNTATEWAENLVLDRHCQGSRQQTTIEIDEHPLITGLDEEQRANFVPELAQRQFDEGEILVRQGEVPEGLFLITSGRVSTTVTAPDDVVHRITTLSAGMSFGEMPLLLDAESAVEVQADNEVTAWVLPRSTFLDLTSRRPDLKLALLERLATGAYQQMSAVLDNLGQRRT